MQQHFTCRDKAYSEAFKGVPHTPQSAPAFAKVMLSSPAVCWWTYSQTMPIREPGQHGTNCVIMASLGCTGFKQIANKLIIHLATELSSLALMYNTHKALVTKTWDWLKSAINMQNFKIIVHGLQRPWLWMWLAVSTSLCLEKVCILPSSRIFFCIHL